MFTGFRTPSPALAVSWLALAVALGGTAVAATVALVKITDGSGTRFADVDVNSRLRTAAAPVAPVGSFSVQNYAYSGTVTPILGPTRATLVLSTITVGNYYDQTNGAKVRVSISMSESATSSCSATVGSHNIATYYAMPGQSFHGVFPTGIVLKPSKAGNYICLKASANIQGSPSSYYLPEVSATGFVESGTFVAPMLVSTSAGETDGIPPKSK